MKPRTNAYQYFKMLLEYILATALLSVLGFLCCYWNEQTIVQKNALWFTLGLFLLLNASKIPLTVYGLRVWTELKKENVSEHIITVQSIKSEKLYNFRTRSGAVLEEKSVLLDTNGKTYHFIGEHYNHLAKMFQGETMHITCLEKTGFLLSVELRSESPNEELVRSFYRYFFRYISLKERGNLQSKVRGRIRLR